MQLTEKVFFMFNAPFLCQSDGGKCLMTPSIFSTPLRPFWADGSLGRVFGLRFADEYYSALLASGFHRAVCLRRFPKIKNATGHNPEIYGIEQGRMRF